MAYWTMLRAGHQTVNMLVEELRAERAALERTVATLREVALHQQAKRKVTSSKRSQPNRHKESISTLA
jgi:hypothetical protein